MLESWEKWFLVQNFYSPISGLIQVQGWIYPTNVFFISLEVFHVKNPVFIVSFSHSTLWIIFCVWYHWLLRHTCWMKEIWGDIRVMIHGISLIIFLFILFNDIMESIDMSWGDDCSFDLFLRSVEAFACVLHL